MKILYIHDNTYYHAENDAVYSPGQFPYSYFGPFLEAFEELIVVGRGEPFNESHNLQNLNTSSGPGVSFELFPNINTISGRITHIKPTSDRLKEIVQNVDGVIIRAVSDLGWIVFNHARSLGKPIALEMAACAWDATWNHGHKLGKVYAPIRFWRDKQIAKKSDFVLYVSNAFLQNRYPTNGEIVVASNVRIDAAPPNILDRRIKHLKDIYDQNRPYVIGLIGNINNRIKGFSDALKAISLIQKTNPKQLIFRQLGPGRTDQYQQQIKDLGLEDVVFFDGMMKSDGAVLNWLDQVDLYIQPSYQEGVPRAMIEAMSRGCPVIGSTAGGIPELIAPTWLHKPGDIEKLAFLITKMLNNPENQIQALEENFAKSQNFTSEKLMPQRIKFWKEYRKFCKQAAST